MAIKKDETKRKNKLASNKTRLSAKEKRSEVTGTDIDIYKNMEEALHLQSEITNNMAEGVVLIRSRDAIIIYANQRFEKMFGYGSGKLIGKNIAIVNAPTDKSPEEIAGEIKKSLKETGMWQGEVKNIKKDGMSFWCQANVSTYKHSEHGDVWIATHMDITRHKQAEEALHASETQYRRLFETARDGILIQDVATGVVTDVNPFLIEMLGFPHDEFLGKAVWELRCVKDSKIVKDLFRELQDKEYVRYDELTLETVDGRRVDVEFIANVYDVDNHRVIQCNIRDITERKLADMTLKQSENKYRELTESISDVFFAMDNDLRYTHWNKASEKLTGVTATDALGKKFFDIFPENEATTSLQEMYLKAIKTQQSQHFISEYPGGQNIIHEITVYPSKDGISIFIKDITERKQAEASLIESESRFRTLIEKAPIAINISRDGKVLYANQKLVELTRETNPEKNIGRPIIDFFIPELREGYQAGLKLRSSGLPAPENYESKILRADGSQIPVQIQGSQLRLSDGMAHIAFITDITERKNAEKEKQELEDKAQVASRLAAVGEMAAGIAHEINNPLTGVIGFSQLLLEKQNVPEDIKDDIRVIADGSKRVADIVKRLLTFARQTKPIKTSVNLNELIDNTLKLREYVLKTENINVVTRFDPELSWTVIDPGQIQQVFLNLIINAEQAMKKAHGKGRLVITTEKKENNIRISFQDDGLGITRENMGHIFEPFFTTKDVGEGTGLGLSLSRSIVLEHGGQMSVESESSLGATFIVELPIVDSSASETENTGMPTKVQPSLEKSGRILVVDDEPGVRALLEKVLTQMGYNVETITDARIVMDKLDAGTKYDLILLDIRMPGMSGTELYNHVLEKAPVLKGKIIIVTGDVMGQDVKDFLRKNDLPYLVKPFDIKLLKEKIADTIKIV